MLGTFSIAVDATLDCISPGKNAVLASGSNHRKHLRKRTCGAGETTIPVKCNVRDVGAHVTFSGTPSGATLNRRVDNASLVMGRIKGLPIPATQRSRLVIGKGYAMGLYGVEATPISCSSLRKLQGRTTDAMVGKHHSMRSPEVALAISGKAGIDIKANILWRRTRLTRRAWHQRPEGVAS